MCGDLFMVMLVYRLRLRMAQQPYHKKIPTRIFNLLKNNIYKKVKATLLILYVTLLEVKFLLKKVSLYCAALSPFYVNQK
jgi:hypothetical protein